MRLKQNLIIPFKKGGLVVVLFTLLVLGCTGGTDNSGSGNPSAGVNLTSAKVGFSGGFVDINGDGTDELVVGAPDASASPKKGAILAYFRTSAGLSSTPVLTVMGENAGDNFGYTFTKLGDVDGDGKSDFAVSALNADGETPLSGAVYVYKGGGTPTLLAKLKGQLPLDKFGFSIAGGDVNGDGKADIIVSAPYTFTDYFQSGAVYIYFGGASISTTPDVTIKGSSVNANIGYCVAAGDINGDNKADIFISAGSKVLVFYGGSSISTSPNVTIRSDTRGHGGSGFGKAIAYLGDINGDGIGDIAIGNPNRSVPATYDNMGSVYIFKGANNLPSEFYEDNATYRLTKIIGSAVGDRFGSSIAVAGDIDGMGKQDILVGAVWGEHKGTDMTHVLGRVYLFHGEHLLENPTMTHDPSHAANTYEPEHTSASGYYGGVIAASSDKYLFTGAPLANSHNGEKYYINIKSGGTKGGGSGSGGGGGGGGHDH